MNIDFVQEIVEEEGPPVVVGCFTGWEAIIFEVEDDENVPSECGGLPPP